jgi:hypothetical protein
MDQMIRRAFGAAVVLRAVDRDSVLCSRHDAGFRLLSAQEKRLVKKLEL